MTDLVPDHLAAQEPHALFARDLPGGAALWVLPMIFTTRIVIGSVGSPTVDDAWCYSTPGAAILAAIAWDPESEREPSGWHRHPPSGRRRPDGDPTKEYVQR